MNISQLTYPTSTIITLQEAKDHLRITDDSQDAVIVDCIKSATSHIEKYTNQILQSATFCAYFDEKEVEPYTCLYIWKYPISTISSIKYLNTSGAETTLDSSSYATDIIDSPVRIYLTSTPITQLDKFNVWRVYFTAGFTNRDQIDAELIGWVKIFTGFYFQTRQPEYTGQSVSDVAYNYEKALDKYRKDVLV
jgi:uncharacterized phiE125 gp8 family phage protein